MKKVAYQGILKKGKTPLSDFMEQMKFADREKFHLSVPDLKEAWVFFTEVKIRGQADFEENEALKLTTDNKTPGTEIYLVFDRKALHFNLDPAIDEFKEKRKFNLTREEKVKNMFAPLEEDEDFTEIEMQKIEDYESRLLDQVDILLGTPELRKPLEEAFIALALKLAEKEQEEIKYLKFF